MTALAAWLILAATSFAQTNVPDAEPQTQIDGEREQIVRELRQKLASSPGAVEALAQRIARSRIADRIAPEGDDSTRLEGLRVWIKQNPDEAAGLMAGLAKDDAEGSHDFESAVLGAVPIRLVKNPHAAGNLLSRLKKSGEESSLLKKAAEDMPEEEKREILRSMFEGRGGQSAKVVSPKDAGGAGENVKSAPGAAAIAGDFYDRLGRSNLRGYSPQLQALQSELNRNRPPGAPALIETGKLDFATLSYPAWAMRYDINKLALRLRYERNLALARALGRELSPEQLVDARIEAELEAAARMALSARQARRRLILERALAALENFSRTAAQSQNPRLIGPALLAELSREQGEAARWISLASVEQERDALAEPAEIPGAALSALIDSLNVDAQAKRGYKERGAELSRRRAAVLDVYASAAQSLESAAWSSEKTKIAAQLDAARARKQGLAAAIADYFAVPSRVAELAKPLPRWRAWLNRLILYLRPSSSAAARLRAAQKERELFTEVFYRIAAGDWPAARGLLVMGTGTTVPNLPPNAN